MAGLVDHVLGCVLYPLMQRGQWAATTEFKLNYLAPVRGGTLVAESTVVSFTKRTAVVRVEVTNEEQFVCVAQGTLLVAEPVKKPGAAGSRPWRRDAVEPLPVVPEDLPLRGLGERELPEGLDRARIL